MKCILWRKILVPTLFALILSTVTVLVETASPTPTITQMNPTATHDVAVVSVVFPTTICVLDTLHISVNILNRGNETEGISVYAFVDINTTTIGDEITVGPETFSLLAGENKKLTLEWKPSAVGNYTISGKATIPVDDHPEDNLLIDGIVTVVQSIVYLDPPTINGTVIGEEFNVSIMIRDAAVVRSWQVGLRFNATLLNCTGFFEGEFLKSVDPSTFCWPGTINNVAGIIDPPYLCSLYGQQNGNGSGRLAYATFKVKAPGVSDIHLYATDLWNYRGDVIKSFNIIDVYTVFVDASPHTVVTVGNSTGSAGIYSSGFFNHAFSIPDKELSFNVTTARLISLSNVTIPKALLSPEPLYDWGVIIDGRRLNTAERTITENATHTFISFTYTLGTHKIQITTRFLSSTVSITLSSTTVAFGWNVTISGGIDPVRSGVTVTIHCRPSGGTWATLDTVTTDLNGNYSYTWTPDAVGTYEFKASWEGDPNTLEAVSEVLALEVIIRDLVVSLEAPTLLRIGYSSLLNATVYNSGAFNESDVELQLLINGTVVDNATIPELPIGESYTLSYLWTAPAVEATYNVTAYAPPKIVSGVGAENDTTNNVATEFVTVRLLWITIKPESGSIGSLATVEGFYFPNQTRVPVTFNDMLIGYAITDEVGYFNFVFNVPVSVPSIQTVKAFYTETNYTDAIFTVIDITPLDIEIDVGTTHFRGETAEFYVQITFKGTTVNATSISALLYKPDGTTEALTVPPPIVTGFYKITYAILGDALNGTYALVIEASYVTNTIEAYGTSFKTFLLSLTLTDELAVIEALIESLDGKIENLDTKLMAILNELLLPKVDEIKDKITAVNATLTDQLALIESLDGKIENIKNEIAAVNATLHSINETISQLETRIDTIKGAQEAFTTPLYAAVVLALIAAVGAILSNILIRRKT